MHDLVDNEVEQDEWTDTGASSISHAPVLGFDTSTHRRSQKQAPLEYDCIASAMVSVGLVEHEFRVPLLLSARNIMNFRSNDSKTKFPSPHIRPSH